MVARCAVTGEDEPTGGFLFNRVAPGYERRQPRW
jgi:hypothetical protein